jgi:hypothetical protein
MALTEKYVSALAGGSGDGLTAGTPFTFDQMKTEMLSASGTGGQGKRYNIKADGTYTRSAGDDSFGSSTAGTQVLPIVLRGYKTTIGDGWQGRTSNNGPLITTNMPLINYTGNNRWSGCKYTCVESLRFTGTTDSSLLDLESQGFVVGCSLTNAPTSSSDQYALRIRESTIAFECDITCNATGSAGGSCIRADAGNVKIDACRVISNHASVNGIKVERNTVITRCLLKGAGGSWGIWGDNDSYRNMYIRDCTITNWGDGIHCDNTSTSMDAPIFVNGCMITDCSGYAINFVNPTQSFGMVGINRVRDNVSGNVNNGATNWLTVGRIYSLVTTDTGSATSDYTNPSGNDYSLISTSPGVGVNAPYYSDLGPYGRAPSGGGTAVFNPLGQFIIRPAL